MRHKERAELRQVGTIWNLKVITSPQKQGATIDRASGSA